MENRRAIILSLICFGVALLLISAYVQVKRGELTSEFGEEVQVVVATKTIQDFAVIRPDAVEIKTVFKNFRQPQTVSDPKEVIGKSAFSAIYPGEQITLTKLVTHDGKPVLDRQVEKKSRAITLPIDPHRAVSRLIRPGNRVDVLCAVNYDTPEGIALFEVKTVVQNALVLATGRNIQNAVPTRVERDILNSLEEKFEERRRKDFTSASTEALTTGRPDDRYSHVTLQLTPEDAEKVLFLSTKYGDGRIFLTLRNSADNQVAAIDTTLLDDVLGPESNYGASKRKPPPAAPPRPPRLIDLQGGQPVGVD